MTVNQLATELARDLGISVFTAANAADNVNSRGVSTGDLEAIAFAINSALQQIWDEAPANLFQRPFGAVLRPPETVTIAVTQYSTACTITGWDARMEGCTIAIQGDSVQNEISYQNVLTRPYMGTTATTTAVIYYDCVPFNSSVITGSGDIRTVLHPVRVIGWGDMRLAGSREEWQFWTGVTQTVTPHTRPAGIPQSTYNKQTGQPDAYFVDSHYQTGSAYRTKLRVHPMPSNAYALEFWATIAPPVYSSTNIYPDSSPTEILIPFPHLYLKPIARWWLSSDSRFVNRESRNEIQQQYKKALESLGSLVPAIKAAEMKVGTRTFRK